jgi:hypothetical protein
VHSDAAMGFLPFIRVFAGCVCGPARGARRGCAWCAGLCGRASDLLQWPPQAAWPRAAPAERLAESRAAMPCCAVPTPAAVLRGLLLLTLSVVGGVGSSRQRLAPDPIYEAYVADAGAQRVASRSLALR